VSPARRVASGARRLRAVASGKAAAPPASVAGVRHEIFAERLRALDGMVERALAESGGVEPAGSWLGERAEAVLDLYARFVREVEGRSLRELLAGLSAGAGARRARQTHDARASDDSLEPLVAPLLQVLYRAWWRVEVAGMEHVPANGPVLLLANHAGGLFAHDAAMLKVALRAEHPARRGAIALVDDLASGLPLVRDLVQRCGALPATPGNAAHLLDRGQAVIAFPEGTHGLAKPWVERYQVRRFGREGFVRAALRSGAVVVPVAIIGAEETHPVLARADGVGRLLGLPYLPITPTFPWLGLFGLVPLPSKWRIEIGPPLPWSIAHDADAAADRALVRRHAEQARRAVQDLVHAARRRRGTAFL